MENIEKKLMQIIEGFSNIEVLEFEFEFARFNLELKKIYEEKIKFIEDNLDNQIKFYGKNIEDCKSEKEKILSKYTIEFQKIYNQRKEQFFNIQVEIQEMQSNQKIAIANFKTVIDNKKVFLKSSEYLKYLKQKQEYQNVIDTTLKSAEFEKYTKLLEEMKDPFEEYSKKLEALVQRYDGYQILIEECEKKLMECLSETKKDFDRITKYRNESLAIKNNTNIIAKFITSLLNKIMRNSKFEKEVVQKMEKELLDIKENNNMIIETINSQTISLIAVIGNVREELNKEFKLAIE